MPKNLIFAFSVLLSACAHSSIEPASIEAPHQAFHATDAEQETVAIVAINDFHGNLLPKERKLPDGRMVKSGGAETLASMINILKQELPGRVIIVDAGDEWQGTLESNLNQGANVVDFYNRLGVSAAAIGNHEFDFGLPNMLKQFNKAHYPYLAANVYEKKTAKRPKWRNVYPSQEILVGPYRIGIIGASTVQTSSTTRYETVAHLDFRDALVSVTKEAEALRRKGSDLVLLTAHAGTTCEDKLGLKSWNLWSESTPNSPCDRDDEIYRLANELKPGALDGIVSGHTHQIIHHFFNHLPVVQDESYNQFFNIIYYTFNRKTKKVIPELTRIEGLIPICAKVFDHLQHCDVRRLPANVSPKLVTASFHGQEIEGDPQIAAWLAPIEASTEKYRKEVIAVSELPLTHYRDKESAFGNLMADVLKENGHADFSLVNSGGIRASLDAGPITFDGLYRALPFDNLLNILQLSGKQVKLLYQIASAGSHGIISFSGLKLTLIPYDREVEKEDLNADGKLERWEGRRLVKIETSDGRALDDSKMYTVATYDFLVTGGDDLNWFMSNLSPKAVIRPHTSFSRDLVTEYLKREKVINTVAHPLVDPSHPRVIFTP